MQYMRLMMMVICVSVHVCNGMQPALTMAKYTPLEKDQTECSICFEDMDTRRITTPCQHVFHKECIEEWKKKSLTCPLCRGEISPAEAKVSLLKKLFVCLR